MEKQQHRLDHDGDVLELGDADGEADAIRKVVLLFAWKYHCASAAVSRQYA